ncbi:MAG TPA: response regulator transcription factor [Acidimicrobiales bacterium]|nr:response regulator transcription factor [Acidimicrobiales bacterium]
MATSVRVEIGPVPGASARAWLVGAQQTMATVRARSDLGIPSDVLGGFDQYLGLWTGESGGDEFHWSGVVDPDLLRHLAAHWARVATMARDEASGSGLLPADPAGEAFFSALVAGMGDALARADDAERFAPKFEEVVPDFEEVRPAGDRMSNRTRVLLVDDNPDIRMLIRIGLENSGQFDVVGEARDGAEAVDAVARSCPDAVLLDLAMPVMDGFEALPRIKATCPACRVVVFSANHAGASRGRVEEAGGDAFLRKDAAIADVIQALRAGRPDGPPSQ